MLNFPCTIVPAECIGIGQGGISLRRTLPIFYNALLLTAVNLLLRFVSTSFQVHISGRIGAAGVGLLQLVMSVGSLAMTAGMAGVRTATMYLTAEELGKKRPENVPHVLSSCFIYSILCSSAVAIALYVAAPVLSAKWIGNPQVTGAVRLFAVFLPIVCLSGCMTGYFTAANRIGTLAIVEILEQLCYMVVTMLILIFWAKSNPEKCCQAVVLGSGISACITLISLVILRLREHNKAGAPISTAPRLLQIAIPLALADDLKAGISTTENLMVPKRLSLYSSTQAPLAAFGMVCGMVFPVLMFPSAILFALAELLIPELAQCAAAGSNQRVKYLATRSLKVALLYGCFCFGILYLLSDALCLSLYGSLEAGQQLRQYAILVPMLYCDAIIDAMNKGLGQQKISVRYNILTSAMDVLFLYLLLPKYGMEGYFFSFLITHLINFLLSLRLLLRTTGISIPFYTPVFAAFSALAAIFGASFAVSTPAKPLSFTGIFGSILVLLGVITRSDFLWIRGMLKKR